MRRAALTMLSLRAARAFLRPAVSTATTDRAGLVGHGVAAEAEEEEAATKKAAEGPEGRATASVRFYL